MRAVRFTKAEVAFLESLAKDWDEETLGEDDWKVWQKLIARVRDAQAPREAVGVAVGPLEQALIAGARGKVVALEGGHARASRQAGLVGATPEDARLVGEWMARQGWLKGNPWTLLGVLGKWHDWLPKARATMVPKLEPMGGVSAEAGQEPGGSSQAAPGGRIKSGFR